MKHTAIIIKTQSMTNGVKQMENTEFQKAKTAWDNYVSWKNQ